jgi:hypothetical protein
VVKKLVGIVIDEFQPGQALVTSQNTLRELLECAVPLIDQREYPFFLIRLSINGWILLGATGANHTPDSPLNYEPIIEYRFEGSI